MAETPWIVVGLGNPGAQYADTRHNVGQMVTDELARRAGLRFTRHKTANLVAEGRLRPGGPRLVLAKPTSFMNTSGGPVSQLVKFYATEIDRLILVHDEIDIPFDTIKLKSGGGHGGHNGIRDVASALRSPEFVRVRVGVGRPPDGRDAADHVLRGFTATERRDLPSLIADGADAVELVIDQGLVAAQLRYHTAS